MDTDLVKYYEERFSMMATQGWLDLIKDIERMYEEYNKVSGLGATSLDFRKGQLDILSWVLGLKDISEHTYKELTDETIL